jgi:DSF synthase
MNTVRHSSEVLFKNFKHIKIEIKPEQNAVWVYLDPLPTPCITRTLLSELKYFQQQLVLYKGQLPHKNTLVEIKYHIVTSHYPVFSFGGDLKYFFDCIDIRDEDGLRNYAYSCIDTMYPNLNGFDLGITTISLIHGNALGGGFEAALSSNVLIAEKESEMGFPEVLFNLFPGMGAYNLVSQRVSPALAEKMIMSGRTYSAEELYEMGLIDILAEKGRGAFAVNEFIKGENRKHNTYKAIHKVRNIVNPVSYDNLIDICDVWVESALNLTDKDIRIMKRLVRSQNKFVLKDSVIPLSSVT